MNAATSVAGLPVVVGTAEPPSSYRLVTAGDGAGGGPCAPVRGEALFVLLEVRAPSQVLAALRGRDQEPVAERDDGLADAPSAAHRVVEHRLPTRALGRSG